MCGILGCINIDFKEASLDAIKHRGPDGMGVKKIKAGKHEVTLAHRRLSIVDLSENGTQPMFSGDGVSCIVFNGEIYNHASLKEDVKFKQFAGHSDTETLVNYFNEHGYDTHLKNLNGIFGFAILNQEKKQLTIARDRFGVKPLYYYYKDNAVIFSSEIRPFHHYLEIKYEKKDVIEGLKMRYVGAPHTVFKSILKVEPGQYITFELGGDKIESVSGYYVSTGKNVGSRRQEFSSLVKEYGDLFIRAVERQLMSDVDLGILLSGGIDSALVAAVAKDKSSTQLKSFTVGYAEGLFQSDEIENAKITAGVLGIENQYVRVHFDNFINDLKEVIRIVEEPIATNSIIPMYWLSKLASKSVKVVLTGQGADEPLYGYRKYKGLTFLRPIMKSKSLQKVIGVFANGNIKNEETSRFLHAAAGQNVLSSYREYNTVTSKETLNKLFGNGSGKEMDRILETADAEFEKKWSRRLPSDSAMVSFPYLDTRTSLADDLLMYADKILMHFGVEGRVPILDNDLIEFIESLHYSYKFSFRKGKIIHKKFAEEYLPGEIINRKKIGFATPASAWYKTYQKEIEEIICSNKAIQHLFDEKAVKEIIVSHSKNENREKQILLLLSFALLAE